MQFEEVRNDPQKRSDYIERLTEISTAAISFAAKQIGGRRLSEDYITNECTQAFRETAYRAVTTARIGEGLKSPLHWCRMKGLNGVKDFVRGDLGLRLLPEKQAFAKSIVYASEFPQALRTASDALDYATNIVSLLTVQQFLDTLDSEDRAIVELLIFGYSRDRQIKCSGIYGDSRRSSIIADIATSMGCHSKFVFARMAAIRRRVKLADLG